MVRTNSYVHMILSDQCKIHFVSIPKSLVCAKQKNGCEGQNEIMLPYITKTRSCNIQQYFTAVKMFIYG